MAKTKFSIKVTADNVSSHKNQSTVRFVIEDKPVAGKDGQPVRTAKTVIQCMFTDPETALLFKVDKAYTVTIEE